MHDYQLPLHIRALILLFAVTSALAILSMSLLLVACASPAASVETGATLLVASVAFSVVAGLAWFFINRY